MARTGKYSRADYIEAGYLPGDLKPKFSTMPEDVDPFGSEPAQLDGGEMFAKFLALNQQGPSALMPQLPANLRGYEGFNSM